MIPLDIRPRGRGDGFADLMAGLYPKAWRRPKALAESTH